MITRFVLKDAHVPAEVVETMERRIHQRMDAYFKDEAEGDTVIGVRITEQKHGKPGAGDFPPCAG